MAAPAYPGYPGEDRRGDRGTKEVLLQMSAAVMRLTEAIIQMQVDRKESKDEGSEVKRSTGTLNYE
jgi:hypothetical protein